MWVNFKPDDENKVSKPTVPCGLSRQNSRTSRKSSSSASQLQKKIEEYSFKTNTEEWKKEQEYKERRRKRKLLKKQMKAERKLKKAKLVYVPAIFCIFSGTVLTFGACIRSVSEGTFMWEYREIVRYIGPVLLGVGVLILMAAIALMGHIRGKMNIDENTAVQPFIHPDFLRERQSVSRKSSVTTSCELDDSLNPLMKRNVNREHRKWYECTHFTSTVSSDDSFWSTSTASGTFSHDSQQGMQHRANTVGIRIPEESDNDCGSDNAFNDFVEFPDDQSCIQICSTSVFQEEKVSECKYGLENSKSEDQSSQTSTYGKDMHARLSDEAVFNFNSECFQTGDLNLVTCVDSEDIIEKQYLERSISENSVNV